MPVVDEIQIIKKERRIWRKCSYCGYERWVRICDLKLRRSDGICSKCSRKLGAVPNLSIGDVFWSRVIKSDGCWIWSGSLSKKGYGYLSYNGEHFLAHRFAWKLKYGSIPDGLDVLHVCDNRSCVRDSHLFLGTNYDNMLDKMCKNRQSHKLNEIDVIGILSYLTKRTPIRKIARLYNVQYNSIYNIKAKKCWVSVIDKYNNGFYDLPKELQIKYNDMYPPKLVKRQEAPIEIDYRLSFPTNVIKVNQPQCEIKKLL